MLDKRIFQKVFAITYFAMSNSWEEVKIEFITMPEISSNKTNVYILSVDLESPSWLFANVDNFFMDHIFCPIKLGTRTIASVAGEEFNARRGAKYNQRWGEYRTSFKCIMFWTVSAFRSTYQTKCDKSQSTKIPTKFTQFCAKIVIVLCVAVCDFVFVFTAIDMNVNWLKLTMSSLFFS